MPNEEWKDGLVDEMLWQREDRRPLIICPEPNGKGYEHRRRDMRELLRSKPTSRFGHRLEQLLRFFFNEPEEKKPLLRCAFIDLNKRSGGPFARRKRVLEATRLHATDLVKQIKNLNPPPTSVIVAGKVAHQAFDQYLRSQIDKVLPNALVAYVPHSAAHMSNEGFEMIVKEAFVLAGIRSRRSG